MDIRSINVEDLRETSERAMNIIHTCAHTLLTLFPTYNNDLSKRMGFRKIGSAHDGYLSWMLLQSDNNIVRISEDDSIRKTNIMVDQDIVEAYEYGDMDRVEVESIICAETQGAFNTITDVVRLYITHHPEKAYQAEVSRQVGWKCDRGKSHPDHMMANFIQYLKHCGDIEDVDSPKKQKKFLRATGKVTQYYHTGTPHKSSVGSSSGEAKAAHQLGLMADRGVTFRHQATFPNCTNPATGRKLPFDFQVFHECFPGGFILLEIDGDQHREFIAYFHETYENFVVQQSRDIIKNTFAETSEIRLFRIPYGKGGDDIVGQMDKIFKKFGI